MRGTVRHGITMGKVGCHPTSSVIYLIGFVQRISTFLEFTYDNKFIYTFN